MNIKDKFIENLSKCNSSISKEFRASISEVMKKTITTPENEYEIIDSVDVIISDTVSDMIGESCLEEELIYINYGSYCSEEDIVNYHESFYDAVQCIAKQLNKGNFMLLECDSLSTYMLCSKEDICK